MTTITDEQLSQDCDDLDLSHGPTRLLACALYWRRKYFALAAQQQQPERKPMTGGCIYPECNCNTRNPRYCAAAKWVKP
jgi:hypothetical protein